MNLSQTYPFFLSNFLSSPAKLREKESIPAWNFEKRKGLEILCDPKFFSFFHNFERKRRQKEILLIP